MKTKLKIQYQIEYLIDDDLLSCEIEFTENKAISKAKEMLKNKKYEDEYCLISKLEEDCEGGNYSTIQQDYITIK